MLVCRDVDKLIKEYGGEVMEHNVVLVKFYEHEYENTAHETEKLEMVLGVDTDSMEVGFWLEGDDLEPAEEGFLSNTIYGFEDEVNMDFVFDLVAEGVLEYIPSRKKVSA